MTPLLPIPPTLSAIAILAHWSFSSPILSPFWALLVLLAVAWIALTYAAHSPQSDSRGRRLLLLALRLLAIGGVLLMLLHPVRTRQAQHSQKPVLAVLLDDSRSMSQPAWPNADRSRYQWAQSLMKTVAQSAKDRFELRLYNIRAEPIDPIPPEPAQPDSPLPMAIERIRQDLADRPTAAIVLLSDGRETPGNHHDELDVFSADDAKPTVPIIAVDFARPLPDRQTTLAIDAIATARQALLGGQTHVTLEMRSSAPLSNPSPNEPTHQLSILHGPTVLATHLFAWPDGQTRHRETIRLTLKQAGQLAMTAQVKPVTDSSGSTAWANRTFDLHVRAKPLTVLYLDGVVRWEGKFLRQALVNDRQLQLITRVRSAAVTLAPSASGQSLLNDQSLAPVDVVILGDIDASQLSPHEIASLGRWVIKQGGGLVVTGGYRSFGPGGLGQSELAAILPIEFSNDEHPQIEQPFTLKLTAAGQQSPIFHLTGIPQRDTVFYQSLPPLEGCCRIAGIKPAAQVLAINPTANGPDGQPGLPVMIVQPVGLGRTLVLTADTTWRWRMIVSGFTGDGTFYERFWGQIVRDLAASRSAATGQAILTSRLEQAYRLHENVPLILSPPPHSSPISPVSPAAVFLPSDDATPSVAGMDLTAIACHESGSSQAVLLTPTSQGHWLASLPTSSIGRWNLLITAKPRNQPGGPKTAIIQKQLDWVVLPDEVESLDPQPDRHHLQEIAHASGGEVISLAHQPLEAQTLAEAIHRLPAKPTDVARTIRWELWRDPMLVGCVLICLCLEWILRRRHRWL